jgi:hypothetical protein
VPDTAERWLDWPALEPLIRAHQALIAGDIARDGRTLHQTEAFVAGVFGTPGAVPAVTILRGVAEARRAYRLNHPDVRDAGRLR